MSSIERYYGIDVVIQEEANPFLITYLKDRIFEISQHAEFDVNKFFVYVHYIEVVETKFWGSHIPLDKRVKLIDVRFEVNKKQRIKEQIKFFNELVELEPEEGTMIIDNQPYYIQITYDGKKIINKHLKTHLITFIDKKILRERHKKIKVTIYPQADDEYEKEINKNREAGGDFIKTEKIIFFEKQTKLPIIRLSRRLRQETRKKVALLTYKKYKNPKTLVMQELNNELGSNDKKEFHINTGGGNSFAGDNMNVHDNNFNTQNNNGLEGIDLLQLANELSTLRNELSLSKVDGNFEHIDAIAEIEKAESLSKSKGNGNKILGHLKKAGKWAWDTATKIGVSVAAEAIKRGMQP